MTGGKTFELSNGVMVQPWGRASVIQEFSADNAVRVNGHHFNNDMSGTRGEYAAGVTTQATETLQVYADVRYAKGDKIESPLGGSLGVRWTW
ncbi:autotransporter outer membrane beta-barrel domain-containing protein [Enterobacter adelaidei]